MNLSSFFSFEKLFEKLKIGRLVYESVHIRLEKGIEFFTIISLNFTDFLCVIQLML